MVKNTRAGLVLTKDQPLDLEMLEALRSFLKELSGLFDKKREPARDHAVHDTRTGMKRVRAMLRLIRLSLDQQTYEQSKRHAKALADLLSVTRDAKVMLDTVDGLLYRQGSPERWERVRAPFLAQAQRYGVGGTPAADEQWREAQALLTRVQDEVGQWSLPGYNRCCLRKAIEVEYRTGRRYWKRLRDAPDEEQLHAWRTVVKRFYYQLMLLFPDNLTKTRHRFRDLGELLGQLHDLHMLKAYVAANRRVFWLDDLLILSPRIDDREAVLIHQIWKLAPKAYRQRPRSFAQRLIRRWVRRA